MRTLVLLLCATMAFSCINDAQTSRSEAEFKAQYPDLPPTAIVVGGGSRGVIGVAVVGLGVVLLGAAIVWRVRYNR